MVSDKKMSSHPNWKALATVAYTYKPFVQESRPNDVFKIVRGHIPGSEVSGEDCRAAYEEVLGVPSEDTGKRVVNQNSVRLPLPKKRPGQHLSRSQLVNALMKEASQNNVQGVADLLGDEREINIKDEFGWTMLMCAAHAGAVDMVKYLLINGADTQVKDKGGNTCMSLARRQKHSEILNLFKNSAVSEKQNTETNKETNKIFCDVCKQHFEESLCRLHKNSTVHLFNIHPRKNSTWYGIPDSNKGFKLMIKSGWNKEQGLGPEGSGTRFPPKTILKRDRKGLGIHSGVARVTHFKPHDPRAIEIKNQRELRHRREPKTNKTSQISRERRKERALRRELNF